MKIKLNFILIFVVLVGIVSCQNTSTKKNKNVLTKIKFLNSKKQDFGKVIKDTIISKTYVYKNIGEKPLILENYTVSCNCTDISFSKKIIKPQESGKIILNLNTQDKHNYVNIYCVLIFNTKQKYYKISMNGFVENNNTH